MSHKQAKRERQAGRHALRQALEIAPRDNLDLTRQLREQLGFLRRSGAAYDDGNEAEAKPLAVTIRLLVHDTTSSHSLLGQLDVKSKIRWVDTAGQIRLRNRAPTLGLLIGEMTVADGATRARYLPPLEDPTDEPTLVDFETWWTRPVSRLPDEDWSISRQDYILAVANKEGGSPCRPDPRSTLRGAEQPQCIPMGDDTQRSHDTSRPVGRPRSQAARW